MGNVVKMNDGTFINVDHIAIVGKSMRAGEYTLRIKVVGCDDVDEFPFESESKRNIKYREIMKALEGDDSN